MHRFFCTAPPAAHSRKGRLFILSGPSGVGKTTLRQHLLARFPDMDYSVSHTTRSPRPGESEGVDYHFTDADRFRRGIAAGYWAEWAIVHGHYYGTDAAMIERSRRRGRDVLLDIDVQGARQMIANYPESITIFIMPPSLETLRGRIEKRSADAPEVIERRLQNAADEMRQRHGYHHIVINDRLTDAVEALAAIVIQSRNDAEA